MRPANCAVRCSRDRVDLLLPARVEPGEGGSDRHATAVDQEPGLPHPRDRDGLHDVAAGSKGTQLVRCCVQQLREGREEVVGVHVRGAAGAVSPRGRVLPDEQLRAVLVGHEDLDPRAAEVQPRDQSPVHSLSPTSRALDCEDRAVGVEKDLLRDASEDELSHRRTSSQPDDDEVVAGSETLGDDRLGRIVVRVQLTDVVNDAVRRQALRKGVGAMLCGDVLRVTRSPVRRC